MSFKITLSTISRKETDMDEKIGCELTDKPEDTENKVLGANKESSAQNFSPHEPKVNSDCTSENSDSISLKELHSSVDKPRTDYLPYPPTPLMLINEISKLFRDRIRDENMQNSYRMLLFHLAIRGGRTQLELANITHLKPPTISVTLQKMEADGYVKRVANERDMRQTLVYLTEKGEEYNSNLRKKIEIIDKEVASGFTDEELQLLVSMLTRVRDNIKQSDDGHMSSTTK